MLIAAMGQGLDSVLTGMSTVISGKSLEHNKRLRLVDQGQSDRSEETTRHSPPGELASVGRAKTARSCSDEANLKDIARKQL